MKIGLLVCDHVREELHHLDKDYFTMFRRLLPDFEITPYRVVDGKFPASPDDEEAFICSGSSFSVYEDHSWIHDLTSFTKEAYLAKKKYVGVCFGHQMIAYSLGGTVEKAHQGWSIGVHEFKIKYQKEWMSPFQASIKLLMMCQDQVTKLPRDSHLLAESSLCPMGMFQMADHFLAIQAHPEFSKEYNQALYQLRAEKIPEEVREKADRSLSEIINTEAISLWIKAFLVG